MVERDALGRFAPSGLEQMGDRIVARGEGVGLVVELDRDRGGLVRAGRLYWPGCLPAMPQAVAGAPAR